MTRQGAGRKPSCQIMIELIYLGTADSRVYVDAQNTMSDLVALARRDSATSGLPVAVRTQMMTIVARDGRIFRAQLGVI